MSIEDNGERNRPAEDFRPEHRAEVVDLPRGVGSPGVRGPRARESAPAGRSAGAPAQADQIVCDNLVRIYKVADLEVVALQGLDLRVAVGEMLALVGASGSGKSTLLNILAALDTPSAGRAVVAGYDLTRLGRADQTRYRRRIVGFVWQQTARNLLPYLSAVENVELPMVLDGRRNRRARAMELLELVGLEQRATHRPERLSGGEQQRAAIAVALANAPPVILADEPTGELDTATSGEVFALLGRVNRELGTTIVIVTHDPLVSEQVHRTVAIRDGRTSSETLHRTEVTDEGYRRFIAEEFAVLDRAGRLQLPKAHIEKLSLEHRVRLRLEPDHVGVWPDRPRELERHSPAPSAGGQPGGAVDRDPSGDPVSER